MNLYDYTSIDNIYIVGDIHGAFSTLFSKINPWSKPKKTNCGASSSLFVSQVIMDEPFMPKKKSYANSIIIVAGDCAIGFNEETYYTDLFAEENEILKENNITLFFIRGNHDDPSFFNGERINFSNIKAISDYSVIKTAKHNILCIGGAISIDRIWRKQQEVLINKYKKNRKKKLYWENEAVIYDENKLNDIISSDIKIDILISHSSSCFAFPKNKEESIKWFALDKNLKHDIEKDEREKLSLVYDFLVSHGNKIKLWAYGHFHLSSIHYDKDKDLTLCSLNELDIKSADNVIESGALTEKLRKTLFKKTPNPRLMREMGEDNATEENVVEEREENDEAFYLV